MVKTFKTTVLGIGPFCVEFEDGEIITTRMESRQQLLSSAPEMLEALEAMMDVAKAEERDLEPRWVAAIIQSEAALNKVRGNHA